MSTAMDRNRRVFIRCEHGLVQRRGLYVHHHQVYALFDELIHRPWGAVRWNPAVDLREDTEAFTVEVDLPGVKPEEVRILTDGKILAIEGQRQLPRCDEATTHLCERPDGRFARTFEFDNELEGRQIESHWLNGVLVVSIPKQKKP